MRLNVLVCGHLYSINESFITVWRCQHLLNLAFVCFRAFQDAFILLCVFLLLFLQLSCGGLCKFRCEADGPGSWPGSETNDPEPEETRHADIISPHPPLHQTQTFSGTFKTIKKTKIKSEYLFLFQLMLQLSWMAKLHCFFNKECHI